MHWSRSEHLHGARRAGLTCMAGGALFAFSFLGLSRVIDPLRPVLEPWAIRLLTSALWSIAAILMAGAPLGLIALHERGTEWRRTPGLAGAMVSLLGLSSYIAGSIYIYNFPDRAFQQRFTPAGSVLLTLGTLLLAAALRGSGRLPGWRAYTPLMAGLYFPLQFPIQAVFFLGAGRGPHPLLLGVWGIFWLLLGYAIWSSARDLATPRYVLGPHPGLQRGSFRLPLIAMPAALALACSGAYLLQPSSSHASTTGIVRVCCTGGDVEIIRDRDGVPHIRAGSEIDAYFGLGFVHAQDRLWQMEHQRRAGSGRLAEILGSAALQSDSLFRTVGIHRAAARTWATYGPDERRPIESYVAGVNAYLKSLTSNRLPPEFGILGFKPEPWRPEDVLVLSGLLSWTLDDNWEHELLRMQIGQKLGHDRAAQLMPVYTRNGPTIIPGSVGKTVRQQPETTAVGLPSADLSKFLAFSRDIAGKFGIGQGLGSNNWGTERQAHDHRQTDPCRRPTPESADTGPVLRGASFGPEPGRHRSDNSGCARHGARPERPDCLGIDHS